MDSETSSSTPVPESITAFGKTFTEDQLPQVLFDDYHAIALALSEICSGPGKTLEDVSIPNGILLKHGMNIRFEGAKVVHSVHNILRTLAGEGSCLVKKDIEIGVTFTQFYTLFCMFRKTKIGEELTGSGAKDVDVPEDFLTGRLEETREAYFSLFKEMFSVKTDPDKSVYYVVAFEGAHYYLRRKASGESFETQFLINVHTCETDLENVVPPTAKELDWMVIERCYPQE